MIISKIEKDYIEVIAIDKTKGKLHQLFHNYNYYLNCNVTIDDLEKITNNKTIYIEDKKYGGAL